jgi:hypothetical protein
MKHITSVLLRPAREGRYAPDRGLQGPSQSRLIVFSFYHDDPKQS